jgi:drug/metabolite transporter (DMT)-like permease
MKVLSLAALFIMQWKHYWKAYAALLMVYLVWGTTIGSIRLGVDSMPWLMLPCLRFLTGGILLVAFSLLKGERLPAWDELRSQILAGLLLFVGGNTIVCWAVGHIPTGIGGLMVATTPFFMIGLGSPHPASRICIQSRYCRDAH